MPTSTPSIRRSSSTDSSEDGRPSRLKIITTLAYAVVAVVVAVVMTGIQTNAGNIEDLDEAIDRVAGDFLSRLDALEARIEVDQSTIESLFVAEVNRLDESNRDRRNQIALLEVLVADNARAVDELRRDVERVLP